MTRKTKAEEDTKKPAALGNKWACPKCSTKFYDFLKTEGKCPKCGQSLNFKDLHQANLAALAALTKKAKPKPVPEEEPETPVVAVAAEIDELDDGPETSLEDLETSDEKEDDY